MSAWIRRHISEHCAYHHRQFCMLQLMRLDCQALYSFVHSHSVDLKARSALWRDRRSAHVLSTVLEQVQRDVQEAQIDVAQVIGFWLDEINWCKRLIHTFPGHEAMWCHLRFLILHWSLLVLALEHLAAFQHEQTTRTLPSPLTTLTTTATASTTLAESDSIDGDAYQPQTWVSRETELNYAKLCTQDDQVARFDEQRQYASNYNRWLWHAVYIGNGND
jgi:hypothetical protein